LPGINKNSKKQVQRLTKKPITFLIGTAALAVVILAFVLIIKPGASTAKPDAAAVKAASSQIGGIVIPVKDITDKATFYPITVDGVKMEAFAVKAPDGTIRTAMNTCQVCYDSGRGYYKQDGDVLICQNCGNRFRTSDVEKVKGGCNPVPVLEEDKVVTKDTITIPAEFLQQAKALFADWKR
jgi:uncharacterized membrane protein